jgi:plastocyanin
MKQIFLLISVLAFTLSICNKTYAGEIAGHVDTDANKTKYKANTVVFIEKADGNFKAPSKNSEMNQKNLTFVPHVLPILAGTTVNFLNNDDVLHNVFSPDACCNKFNLGSWKKGEVKTHKYDKAGCNSVLLCNVHPEMEAYVIVLQNPYFAITDRDGNFSIKNVPAGKYTLKVWNEKLKAPSQEVTVKGKVDVSFQLKK